MKKQLKFCMTLPVMICCLLFGMMGCNQPQANIAYDNKLDISQLAQQGRTAEMERLNVPNEIQMSRSMVYKLRDLQSEGIVQVLRYNKGRYYSVTHVKEGQYLFLLFKDLDGDSLCAVDGFLVSSLPEKSNFNDIQTGMNRDEFLQKDPSAQVLDQSSYHRFADKSILCVKYEVDGQGQYLVSESSEVNQSDSVLNYLLPQDLEQIVSR